MTCFIPDCPPTTEGDLQFVPLSWRAVRQHVRRIRNADNTDAVVLTELGENFLFALYAARRLHAPLIYRTGGVFFGREFILSHRFQVLFKRLRLKLLLSDFVISTRDGTPVDLFMRRMFVPRHKYATFLNGFPQLEPRRSSGDRRDILCISRLSFEKNIDLVIEAFARAMPEMDHKHTLIIAGEGPERQRLEALAKARRVQDRVKFRGHIVIERDDLLQSVALVVAPFAANPVIESIVAGTPVLTVELGETSEIFGEFPCVCVLPYGPGGCGRVPAEHREDLVRRMAREINRILSQQQRYVSYTIQPEHSWSARIEAELGIYATLWDARRRKAHRR